MSRLSLAVLFSVFGFALSPSSYAATASASVDWSQLEMSVVGVPGFASPSLLADSASLLTQGFAVAQPNNDPLQIDTRETPNWTDAFVADVRGGNSRSVSSASQARLAVFASAPIPNNPPDFSNLADADATRSATFHIDGPGLVTFNVPYAVTVDGNLGDFSDTAYGFVRGVATFGLSFGPGAYNQGSATSFLDTANGSITEDIGTMSFGVYANQPGDIILSIDTFAFSQATSFFIPEPSSRLVLFIGLLMCCAVLATRYTKRR